MFRFQAGANNFIICCNTFLQPKRNVLGEGALQLEYTAISGAASFFGVKNAMNETALASSVMLLPGRHFVLVVDLDVVCAHDLNEVLSELEQVVGPLRLSEANEVQYGLLRVRV